MIVVVTYISSDRPPILPATGIKKNAYLDGGGGTRRSIGMVLRVV